jgi:hypothetical protein
VSTPWTYVEHGIAVDATELSPLLSSLRALPHLSSFEFSGTMTAYSAIQLLLDGLGAAVPQLRELRLRDLDALTPLTALSTCTQLRLFSLSGCLRQDNKPSRPADDVLLLLQSLRHLEVVEVIRCELLLTDAQRVQLTPPSLLIPSLHSFQWT